MELQGKVVVQNIDRRHWHIVLTQINERPMDADALGKLKVVAKDKVDDVVEYAYDVFGRQRYCQVGSQQIKVPAEIHTDVGVVIQLCDRVHEQRVFETVVIEVMT